MVTKESYVTMTGLLSKCPILFMIDFVFKYHSECFYISRTFVVFIRFFTFDISLW